MSANYYRAQITKVITAQEDSTMSLKFQVFGDKGKTNWMNLNSESAAEMIGLCQAIISQEKT